MVDRDALGVLGSKRDKLSGDCCRLTFIKWCYTYSWTSPKGSTSRGGQGRGGGGGSGGGGGGGSGGG